jgi:hypothetical protein
MCGSLNCATLPVQRRRERLTAFKELDGIVNDFTDDTGIDGHALIRRLELAARRGEVGAFVNAGEARQACQSTAALH